VSQKESRTQISIYFLGFSGLTGLEIFEVVKMRALMIISSLNMNTHMQFIE